MENRRNIIMDGDPGIDDAVALCLAAAHPEAFHLLAFTTVTGNQTIDKVTENARRLVEFYGLDIPVAKGSVVPILRKIETASDIHGKNGMGNVELPKPVKPLASENGVLFLYETIKSLPEGEKVTLVPTGPLTNIALLFRVFPEVKERVDEIVLMGGAAFGGNVTPTGEFNIYEDPEAAAIVFDSGLPIVMCGLDATNLCGIDREHTAKLMGENGAVCRAVGQMVQFYLESVVYKDKPYASIHDAVTFMYLLHPEIFKAVKMPVSVDCSENKNRGMTVCDIRDWNYDTEPSTTVLMDADSVKFQEYLVEAVYTLDRRLGK
ncbi:MAG: nucleoside hydrolase [Eubacteriales bacterium]|nr:nucleoside hydrolase [Eubacteriales bacterium]